MDAINFMFGITAGGTFGVLTGEALIGCKLVKARHIQCLKCFKDGKHLLHGESV